MVLQKPKKHNTCMQNISPVNLSDHAKLANNVSAVRRWTIPIFSVMLSKKAVEQLPGLILPNQTAKIFKLLERMVIDQQTR